MPGAGARGARDQERGLSYLQMEQHQVRRGSKLDNRPGLGHQKLGAWDAHWAGRQCWGSTRQIWWGPGLVAGTRATC